MVFSLIYVSHATAPFDDQSIQELANKASEKNKRLEITGYLNYTARRKTFSQYLEGARDAVVELMAEIDADERHKVQTTVHLGENPQRLFANWSMRYLADDFFHLIQMEDVVEELLLKMSQEQIDRSAILATLERLSKRITAQSAW